MKSETNGRENVLLKIIPFFSVAFFIAAVCLSCIYGIKYRIYDFFPMVTVIVLLFILTRTYLSHEKNVMKAALSAILAILVSWELYYLADSVSFLFFTEDAAPEFNDWFTFLIRIFSCLLFTVIMIFHFLLISEHKSRPGWIGVNTVAFMLVVLLFVISLGNDTVTLFQAVPGKKWWGITLSSVFIKLFEISALHEVIKIEMLLDMFKGRREKCRITE